MKVLHSNNWIRRSIIKKFIIKRFTKNKAYLKTKLGDALIDKEEVKGLRQNDSIEAYIYHDINNVLRASRNFSYDVGEIYSLKSVEIDKNGVYFEIKGGHIFLPYKERTYKIIKDMTYPLTFKEDNGYLYLTSKIRDFLSNNHHYKENDQIKGRIYSINKSIGAFVAIDNKYDSLIRISELNGVFIEGELVEARVKEVKSDGKIELSLRQRAYLEINNDSDKILDYLYDNKGVVYLSDKSSPEKIYSYFSMSKSSFKRAIGRLYKNKDIRIFNDRIELN